MKSKEDAPPMMGVKKNEFMQASSFNFIENEKMYISGSNNYQTDVGDSTIRAGKHTTNSGLKNIATKRDVAIEQSTKTISSSRTNSETMVTQGLITSDSRKEPGRYAPKRYVTTCYFQPKANPVSYSETVILTLGSNKKHYFDTVLYQTKMIPFRWTESMTTLTAAAEGEVAFEARHEAFVEEPKYHYMSLEPQQTAAIEKLQATEEIAV